MFNFDEFFGVDYNSGEKAANGEGLPSEVCEAPEVGFERILLKGGTDVRKVGKGRGKSSKK